MAFASSRQIGVAGAPGTPRVIADSKKSIDRIQSRLQSTRGAQKFAEFIVNAAAHRYLDLANGIVRMRFSALNYCSV
jgi:hypothetical protein